MTQSQFQAFYESTNRHLWRYLYRLAGDAELACDIMQESFVKLLQANPKMRTEQAARTYLFTIATNLVRDHWRHGRVHGQWVEEAVSEDTDNSASALPLRLDMESALGKLSLMHRSLLWLTYVEGYSHDEVAQMLSIQSTSVRVLLLRARRKLADWLCDSETKKESGV